MKASVAFLFEKGSCLGRMVKDLQLLSFGGWMSMYMLKVEHVH